jgi:hypothetical protein
LDPPFRAADDRLDDRFFDDFFEEPLRDPPFFEERFFAAMCHSPFQSVGCGGDRYLKSETHCVATSLHDEGTI